MTKIFYDAPMVNVDGNMDKALRMLRKRLKADGIFQRLKDRKRYVKPGDKRRHKERRAASRQKKRMVDRSPYGRGV